MSKCKHATLVKKQECGCIWCPDCERIEMHCMNCLVGVELANKIINS